MGYQSDWKLAIHGPKAKVQKMIKWMKEQRSSASDKRVDFGTSPKQVWESILECQEKIKTAEGEMTVVWGDPGTKCYEPWTAVIHDILSHARDNLKIDAAYARLGEEINDHEFDNGEELYIPYSFHLLEVET